MADGKNTEKKIGSFVMVSHDFINSTTVMKYHRQARWLYVALLYFRNHKTGEAFPSYTTLAKLTKMNREGISKGLKELEYWGWINKKRQFGNSSVYTVHLVRQTPAQVDRDHNAGKPLDFRLSETG